MLKAAGKDLLELPVGQWIHFDVVAGLGAKTTGGWDLAVTLPNAKSQRFNALALDKNWSSLTWLGFVSNAVSEQVFYLDNIELVPVAD